MAFQPMQLLHLELVVTNEIQRVINKLHFI